VNIYTAIFSWNNNEKLLMFRLFSIVIILGISVAVYLYIVDKHSLVYYGDSDSHLVHARQFIDSMHPGLQQIGTTWLPLPHFLLAPISMIDPLFKTGFAGLVVSLSCLGITSLFLFRIITLQTDHPYIGFVGGLIFASNPNILYLGMTAMTEAPFMLFFVGSAYYFLKWYHTIMTNGKLSYLVKCSFFISMATLCRYEGWLLPVFLLSFVILFIVKTRNQLNMGNKHKILPVLISFISFLGILFWVIWNAYEFGDPLKFANAQYYSSASQATTILLPYREALFLQPSNVLLVYGKTALMMYGPVLLLSAAMGYYFHRQTNKKRGERTILYFYLGIPSIFIVVSLIIGIASMGDTFNSRFLILISPLVVVLCSVLIKKMTRITKNTKRFAAISGIVGVLLIYNIILPVFGVVTFLDAKGGFFYKQTPYGVQTGEAIGSRYNGTGTIMMLTGSAQENRIMLSSGIALRTFDEVILSSTWKSSFREPWLYDKWIIMSKEPDPDGISVQKYWLNRQSQLNNFYKIAYENKYYTIFVRK
jgi:hypothetical protein